MYAYFYFGSEHQDEVHEMIEITDIPQCGDQITSQNGMRAVVTNVIVNEGDEHPLEPFQCPVEVYCHH